MKLKKQGVALLLVAAMLTLPIIFAACGEVSPPRLTTDGQESSSSPSESSKIPIPSEDPQPDSEKKPTPTVKPSPKPTIKPTPTPTPVPTPTPPPVPPKPMKKVVSFLAAGDNIIHESVFKDAMRLAKEQKKLNGYNEKYYFNSMYDGVKDLIAGADLAFVNQECPVAGEEYGIAGYPQFNAPMESVNALKEVGFDIINVANNHMLDMEYKCTGLKNTIENVGKSGMLMIGGYTKEDYDHIRVIEKNGIKIAFLSYATFTNIQNINKNSPDVMVPKPKDEDIIRQTALAKKVADFVVVSIHWGDENHYEINSEQKRLAKLMNEQGVDVILGHHSHTIQKAEFLKSESGHQTLCYYSLGNFLSTQHAIKNLTGIFASFQFVIDENGNKYVEEAYAIPHLTWYSMERDHLQVYLLENVTSDLIEKHGSQKRSGENGLSHFDLDYVKRYVYSQIPKDFQKK